MVGMKSSATVQQMQPFASSTMFSSGQLASAQDFRISPSTPSLPNSLTSTASFLPPALVIRCRISVVLPEPRKPVMTVTGIFASELTLQPPTGIRGESAPATACGRFRAGRGGIGSRARDNIPGIVLRHPAIDIGPAAWCAERHRAAIVAGGETLDRHHVHALGRADLGDGPMQELARRGLPFGNGLSCLAGDADMKRDGHRPSNQHGGGKM